MRCEHGNLVRLVTQLVSPPYFDDGQRYKVHGCDQCPGIEIEEHAGNQNQVLSMLWISNDGEWHEGTDE